ncbi:MAG: hypothetical protein KDE26_04310 [Bacteroidetes bacterium]|nr:hypothetical protein [Bacteroidota bacterium]
MSVIRDLVVFKKLTVSQILIEPKRVKAIYTLQKNDQTEVSNELIYSYDNPYFDKKNPKDVNLASMMVAQVALNYGLFCEIIEFGGLYDEVDRRFLTAMMENTSREIFVNKFLFKNEFLKPPFDQIQPQQMKRYTAAELVFSNSQFSHLKLEKENAQIDLDQYAILSSGGKDSLLTYGLIKEIGVPHPIFVNESGRHWFTAINSYQHFKETEPNTAKPWCNSDRIFNWMVRQMPFIKENFQNIRADIYPIRLWTVAVFLFGVLPVARKRGVGNILIGNEYDCTLKTIHEGILHYNALYDQSKYFDNALTRYYQRKGWNIFQYSILRSLSELLILKVLVKRYPDLQRHQVSCHAAHQEEGRMYPCGKCEKCRRIIGMLKALDEDPGRCGYQEGQITQGLQALSQKSVKQIGSDAAHLYHILTEKSLLPLNEHTKRLARQHPQIMQLRFDKERSNPADLPPHIREKIFPIYLQYANGMVKMKDHRWQEVEDGESLLGAEYFLNKQAPG